VLADQQVRIREGKVPLAFIILREYEGRKMGEEEVI